MDLKNLTLIISNTTDRFCVSFYSDFIFYFPLHAVEKRKLSHVSMFSDLNITLPSAESRVTLDSKD